MECTHSWHNCLEKFWVLPLNGQDGIAKEKVYHRSCFTQYINKRQLKRLSDQAVDSELAENGNVKRQAFSRVIEWIENTVLADFTMSTDMSEICNIYTQVWLRMRAASNKLNLASNVTHFVSFSSTLLLLLSGLYSWHTSHFFRSVRPVALLIKWALVDDKLHSSAIFSSNVSADLFFFFLAGVSGSSLLFRLVSALSHGESIAAPCA